MKIVHCNKEKYDIYIGRPSKWGNPFSHLKDNTIAKYHAKNRNDAINKFQNWIEFGEGKYLLSDLHELRGKTLGCWCSPKKCHGDVLIELVNKYCNMETFKVIIAGGREFNDYKLLKRVCDHMLKNQSNIEIVSGKARGADKLGEDYAREHNYPIKEFPAKWNEFEENSVVGYNKITGKKYNPLAGFIRNEEMAKYADALILFWDGKTTGSKNMLDLAKKYKLKYKVHKYENHPTSSTIR